MQSEPTPTPTEILDCSTYIISGFDSAKHEINIQTTTPVKSFKVTKSSNKIHSVTIKDNTVTFIMDTTDEKHWAAYYDVEDQCEVWHSSMKTLD